MEHPAKPKNKIPYRWAGTRWEYWSVEFEGWRASTYMKYCTESDSIDESSVEVSWESTWAEPIVEED